MSALVDYGEINGAPRGHTRLVCVPKDTYIALVAVADAAKNYDHLIAAAPEMTTAPDFESAMEDLIEANVALDAALAAEWRPTPSRMGMTGEAG